MRVLFTGGGSGGHIYPILAVSEELKNLASQKNIDLELYYIGAPGDFAEILENEGIAVSKIFSAKMRRYFSPRNLADILFFLPLSFIQAFWKIFWLMPDVLFSKGGPSSLPVVVASRFYGASIIIHDSDSTIGLSNQLALKFADRFAVSFESAEKSIIEKAKTERQKSELSRKIALTGNPIRPSLVKNAPEKESAEQFFGFKTDKPLILAVGGSQGAVKINDFMLGAAKDLIKEFQILHQTGSKNFDGVKNELNVVFEYSPDEEKNMYKIKPYFENDLKNAYAAADLVISRASGGAIFEIAAFSKPSILIPIPEEIVGDHQIKNAYEYAASGAAVVVEQENLTPHIFLNEIKKLLSNPEKLKNMSLAAKKFSKPEAAKIIAEEILKLSF